MPLSFIAPHALFVSTFTPTPPNYLRVYLCVTTTRIARTVQVVSFECWSMSLAESIETHHQSLPCGAINRWPLRQVGMLNAESAPHERTRVRKTSLWDLMILWSEPAENANYWRRLCIECCRRANADLCCSISRLSIFREQWILSNELLRAEANSIGLEENLIRGEY